MAMPFFISADAIGPHGFDLMSYSDGKILMMPILVTEIVQMFAILIKVSEQ